MEFLFLFLFHDFLSSKVTKPFNFALTLTQLRDINALSCYVTAETRIRKI